MYNLGRIDDCLECYRKVVTLDPKDPEIWFDLGALLVKKALKDRALSALGECVRLDPKFAPAYFSRGKLTVSDEFQKKKH